jgi:hypothetical protein
MRLSRDQLRRYLEHLVEVPHEGREHRR